MQTKQQTSSTCQGMWNFIMGKGIVLVPLMLLCQAYAQNCGCSDGLCCSQYGYCGHGDDHCGSGCQQGSCHSNANSGEDRSESSIIIMLVYIGSRSVSSIITKDFFDGILAGAPAGCAGRNFYTYEAFRTAANDNAYSGFGTTGSSDDAKRELAAFFAHVTHSTGSFCYIEQINRSRNTYCNKNATQYPCVSGKSYYGRGPIQLTWNSNYGLAGKHIGFDGLNEPELVARDVIISFKTAVWFWMNGSECHNAIISGRGFGVTIKAVNGELECNDGKYEYASISYYKNYCKKLGVEPGSNLYC